MFRRRVLPSLFLLASLLHLIRASEPISRQRHKQHRYWNESRPLHISGIYPYISPPRETSIQLSSSLFGTHPFMATAICVLVILMILCTLIGNAMVCVAVALVRKLKQQPSNLLLVSLAVADFCVGLFVMPIALITIIHDEWLLGNAICAFWTTADLMLCTASIMNLCLISVDRYLAVTKPLTYIPHRTRKCIFVYILIVWICSLLVSTTPLIVFPIHRTKDSCEVSQNQVYQLYATVLSFYAPCLIMVILYWRMWKAAKILRQKDQENKCIMIQSGEGDNNKSLGTGLHPPKNGITNGSTSSLLDISTRRSAHRPSSLLHAIRVPLIHSKPNNHDKIEDKARKTLGVIMSVFIVCWLPFFLLALIKSLGIITVAHWFDLLIQWLGFSNSMLNPILYSKYNREFRIPFREMLCCRFSTIQTVVRSESFATKFGPSPRMTDLRNSTTTAAAVLAIPNLASSSQPVRFSLEGDGHQTIG